MARKTKEEIEAAAKKKARKEKREARKAAKLAAEENGTTVKKAKRSSKKRSNKTLSASEGLLVHAENCEALAIKLREMAEAIATLEG